MFDPPSDDSRLLSAVLLTGLSDTTHIWCVDIDAYMNPHGMTSL